MRIIVRHIRLPFFTIVIQDNITIFQVKQQIHSVIGVPVDDQTVCYHGRVLPDRLRIFHLHLCHMSTIYVSAPLVRRRVPKITLPSRPRPTLDELSNTPGYERLHRALQANPRLAHAVRDSELMGESASARSDPVRRFEYLKSVDRIMNIVESRPSGSRDILTHYLAVDEIRNALIDSSPPRLKGEPTVIPGRLRAPSTAPLPHGGRKGDVMEFLAAVCRAQLDTGRPRGGRAPDCHID
jgi:hypothetical protein